MSEAPESDEQVVPEPTGKQKQADRDARKKLSILATQIRDFAKTKNLQVFIFGEGLKPGTTTQWSYSSQQLMTAMIMHCAMQHPEVMESAAAQLEAYRKSVEKNNEVAEPAVEETHE